MYKRKMKNVMTQFAYDLLIELQKKDANQCSIKQVYDFCESWVEKNMKMKKDLEPYVQEYIKKNNFK